MALTSRYPLDDTPPLDLFDPADARSVMATAEAVLRWVEPLDQPMGFSLDHRGHGPPTSTSTHVP